MKIIGCIPARFQSTRLPGKPLKNIAGKPMILHILERASQVKLLDEIICLTDDERIFQTVTEFGYQACMTSSACQSGTDRIIDYLQQNHSADILVNIQGDEVLLNPKQVDQLIQAFLDNPERQMATLAHWEKDIEQISLPSTVKVVTDHLGHALYFSRQPIPGSPSGDAPEQALMHIGVYIYTRETLQQFAQLPASKLENIERLEQLRALENGIPIQVVTTKACQSLSVDTEADLARARSILENRQAEPAE